MKNLKKILASLLAVSMVASFASFSVSAAVGEIELGRGEVLFEENFNNLLSTDADALAELNMSHQYTGTGTVRTISDASENPWYTTSPVPVDGKCLELKTTATAYSMIRIPISAIDGTGDGIYLFEADVTQVAVSCMGVKFDNTNNNGGSVPDAFVRVSGGAKNDFFIAGTQVAKSGMPIVQSAWSKMAIVYNAWKGELYFYEGGRFRRVASIEDNGKGTATKWADNIPNVAYFMFGVYGKGRGTFDNIKITKLSDEDLSIFGMSTADSATVSANTNNGTRVADLAAAKTSGTVYVTANGYNPTGEDATVRLIAAAYDVNGNLVAVQSDDATIAAVSAGSPAIELNEELLAANVTEIKFFAWDGLATMVPMTQSVSFN